VADATFTVDGRTIGYADLGDPAGAPVIAAHGAPGSRLMFIDTPDLTRLGLRLVSIDRPGCGLSDRREGFTIADAAADAVALADHLGFDRFATLGVSGAGRTRWRWPRPRPTGCGGSPWWPASARSTCPAPPTG
jgi:pimeloyl-ACP methyl ester carboxylesterase